MKKVTIDFIKNYAETFSYKCISEIYINRFQSLDWICPNSHSFKMTWNNFRNGNRCSECSGKKKKDLLYISNYLKSYGYFCLSKTYINSYTKNLKVRCPKDHIYNTSWTNFQQGRRCFECFGSKKKSKKEVKKYIKSHGYKWISGKYKNIFSKLELGCNRGHIYFVRYDQFQAGHKCPFCHHQDNIIKFTGIGNPNWRGGLSYEPYCELWTTEYKNYIKQRDGYKCLNPCCKSLNKRNLVVHHIDYNKKNCDQFNLITLCNTCNTEANFNRNWHKSWYKAIIIRRYIL